MRQTDSALFTILKNKNKYVCFFYFPEVQVFFLGDVIHYSQSHTECLRLFQICIHFMSEQTFCATSLHCFCDIFMTKTAVIYCKECGSWTKYFSFAYSCMSLASLCGKTGCRLVRLVIHFVEILVSQCFLYDKSNDYDVSKQWLVVHVNEVPL